MSSPKHITTIFSHTRLQLMPRFCRQYHSQQQSTFRPYTRTEDAILSAALTHVPAQGFSKAALHSGAHDAGYLDATTNIFPSGAFAIVEYHLVSQRSALSKQASSPPNSPPPSDITRNLRLLVLHRLLANKPIIHRWQEALALLSMAKHVPIAVKELALLSDELLYLAGSTTVSTSWYTNRAALAAIYASAELFMTTDTSKDFGETQAFLERRLSEGEQLRGSSEMIGKWATMQVSGLVDGLRSKGVWI